MARPHIEFVQSQNLPWSPGPDGAERKVFSTDPVSAESAFLMRVPAGWRATRPAGEKGAEEFLVLEGAIEIDGQRFGRHAYGFFPADHGWTGKQSQEGATLLVWTFAEDDADAATGGMIAVDAAAMPWDVSTYDPKLIHLRLARKVLRMGPNDSGRTYLLTGLPHGRPDVEALQLEKHPHCEEMFLISGEMSAPEGLMTSGAYFFRPPGIAHGPHVSDLGFLMIMRNPGSNRVITEWQDETGPLPVNEPFTPVLPDGSPEAWRQPEPQTPQY